MKKIYFLFIVLSPVILFGQKDSLNNKNQGKLFANIYSGFYYQHSNIDVKTGFEISTALLGYSRVISKKIKGTIIFDVTRTTNNIQVTDSLGNPLSVSFFEGSKYTAFLKMAEIEWTISPMFKLSFGQLLNTQYLTLQDKFWEHRYVETTFQEYNRLGMPADFGARLIFIPSKKLKINIDAFNGDGPFKYQDENSNFLVSGNIEYKPIEEFIAKAYFSNYFTSNINLNDQQTLSLFLGYKKTKFTIGVEYDKIFHRNFLNENIDGFSGFAFYNFSKTFQLFYRFDLLMTNSSLTDTYQIGGLQYSPVKGFYASLNYRFQRSTNSNMIYVNLGLKM